jgi:hypothetical protein
MMRDSAKEHFLLSLVEADAEYDDDIDVVSGYRVVWDGASGSYRLRVRCVFIDDADDESGGDYSTMVGTWVLTRVEDG